MTDVSVLEQIEVDVSLDDTPRCEWGIHGGQPQCPNEATWVGVAKPCGHQLLICGKHRDASMDMMDRMNAERGRVWCKVEEKVIGPHRIEALDWRKL